MKFLNYLNENRAFPKCGSCIHFETDPDNRRKGICKVKQYRPGPNSEICIEFKKKMNEENYKTVFVSWRPGVAYNVFKNPSAKEITFTAKGMITDAIHLIRYLAEPSTNSMYIWNANADIHDEMAKNMRIVGFPSNFFWGMASAEGGKMVPEDDLKCGKNINKADFKKFSYYFKDVKELERQYNPKWLVIG
jgi:hypothetical protein